MFLEWYRNAITGASRPHFHQERESIVETVEYPVQAKRRFWMDVHPAIQTFWPVPRVLDHMDQLALFLGGWSYHFVFLPGSSQQFRFKPSREPSGMTTFFLLVSILPLHEIWMTRSQQLRHLGFKFVWFYDRLCCFHIYFAVETTLFNEGFKPKVQTVDVLSFCWKILTCDRAVYDSQQFKTIYTPRSLILLFI